jgi:hypothetical protein
MYTCTSSIFSVSCTRTPAVQYMEYRLYITPAINEVKDVHVHLLYIQYHKNTYELHFWYMKYKMYMHTFNTWRTRCTPTPTVLGVQNVHV